MFGSLGLFHREEIFNIYGSPNSLTTGGLVIDRLYIKKIY